MMKELFTGGEIPSEQQLEKLADIYKEAFARPPWNEISQCVNEECPISYSDRTIGDCCQSCGDQLKEAYSRSELIAAWTRILEKEDGFMELESADDGTPIRTTIARPTTSQELYTRKYVGNREMDRWLQVYMPDALVWIEDTFANLKVRSSGNLKDRAKTLQNIAKVYDDLPIYTRTIAPEIVAATVRAADKNVVYLGMTDKEKMTKLLRERKAEVSNVEVPDFRTLIAVNGLRRAS